MKPNLALAKNLIFIMAISKEIRGTTSKYVYYALQLYFSGISLQKASQRLLKLSRETMFRFGT